MGFTEIKPHLIEDNPFNLIGKDWMLVTAGTSESFNTMTASWGGMGVLWERQVAFCFIRPTRYTYQFLERSSGFSLSFFEERYKKALTVCGTRSGRDTDKVKEAGLTPQFEGKLAYFNEARIVLLCDKLYFQDISPERFLDHKIHDLYPQKDYHRMYVGEIRKCLIKNP